jgi:hypothetical protein
LSVATAGSEIRFIPRISSLSLPKILSWWDRTCFGRQGILEQKHFKGASESTGPAVVVVVRGVLARMSLPRRMAGDGYLREERREGSMFALIIITVALVVIFVYDLWKTWRRETAWRRALDRGDDPADR